MQHYELTYIVSIKYLDADLQRVSDTIEAKIKELGGEITSTSILGKLRLAYPIKATHQGTYVVVEFNLEPLNLKKLDEQFVVINEVLRHLIIVKKIKTKEEIEREAKIAARLKKEEEAAKEEKSEETKKELEKVEKAEEQKIKKVEEVKIKEKEDNKTSLEDLDKKLDEILKEEII